MAAARERRRVAWPGVGRRLLPPRRSSGKNYACRVLRVQGFGNGSASNIAYAARVWGHETSTEVFFRAVEPAKLNLQN